MFYLTTNNQNMLDPSIAQKTDKSIPRKLLTSKPVNEIQVNTLELKKSIDESKFLKKVIEHVKWGTPGDGLKFIKKMLG